MVSRADAERLGLAQNGIRVLVERDLTSFFGSLNLEQPKRARDLLLEFVPLLVRQYGEAAAAIAADWYDDVRAAEGVRGVFRAEPVTVDEAVAIERTVRRTAGALWSDTPEEALVGILSKAGKYTLSSSRTTVMRASFADPGAYGWRRVTQGVTCRFCHMLAGRGAVYREETAHFAAHGHCDCAAVPSFDPSAPPVDVRLYEASKRTTHMSPAQKAEHNALIRRAIEQYTD